MAILRRIADFLLYSNLFIAACSAGMSWQTLRYFPASGAPQALLPFIASATLGSYSLHWFLTKPGHSPRGRMDWTRRNKKLLFTFFAAAGLLSLYCFTFLLQHIRWIGPAAMMTILYTSPKLPLFKKLRFLAIGKTFILAATWVYVTTLMVLGISGREWTLPIVLFTSGRFFLVYCICILFDHRDREADAAEGISSLPQLVSDRWLTFIYRVSLILCFICLAGLYRVGTPLLPVTILAVPAVILGLITQYAFHHDEDYLYYGVLDGLMMFSSLLTLLISF
jgi:4-hydroxybenzoate polyprenyltransferase